MQIISGVRRIEGSIRRLLERFASFRLFSAMAGVLAVATTVSMTVPTTTVLLFAVLIKPSHWTRTWLWASFGSAIGGAVLVMFFHELGWAEIYAAYPQFATSESWLRVEHWVAEYGLYALVWIAGLPLPQTPALIFCSISRLPVEGVFVAMLIGKLVKYGFFCWAVAHFPERFERLRNTRNR